MKKQIALYALVIAFAAFALEWLEYRYFMQSISTEIYVIVLARRLYGIGGLGRPRPDPKDCNRDLLRKTSQR